MGSSPGPPPAAPDPTQTAETQAFGNVETAIAQGLMNNTNQFTPYGNINYQETGGQYVPFLGSKLFIPQFTASTNLSPGMQSLFDTSLANSQTAADTASALGKNVQSQLSQNVDLGPSATSAFLDRLNRETMDPQWNQAEAALDQKLANQGLTPGSAGWKYEKTQFGLDKANAYNNMYLQGQNTAVQDILSTYNEPINILDALKTGAQVYQPGIGTIAPAAQEQIQPPPYANLVQSNYADQTAQYNARVAANAQEMAGLFGLGGNLISGGLGLLSDRRDKKDIEKLGEKDGIDVYAYRYKNDKPGSVKTVGPMAQDVERKFPGSTFGIGSHRVIRLTARP